MIKLVYRSRKKAGLSDDDLWRCWSRSHTDLARSIPGLRSLVQIRAIRAGSLPANDFHGIAELCFDDLDALELARRTAYWQRLNDDEPAFFGPGAAFLVTVEGEVEL